MDIISQPQQQADTIASLAFNTFGTLQRDTPPVRLSPNYPEAPAPAPAANPPSDNAAAVAAEIAEQPKLMSAALVKAAKQAENEEVGQELQNQLEAAEEELTQAQASSGR